MVELEEFFDLLLVFSFLVELFGVSLLFLGFFMRVCIMWFWLKLLLSFWFLLLNCGFGLVVVSRLLLLLVLESCFKRILVWSFFIFVLLFKMFLNIGILLGFFGICILFVIVVFKWFGAVSFFIYSGSIVRFVFWKGKWFKIKLLYRYCVISSLGFLMLFDNIFFCVVRVDFFRFFR